MSDLKMSDVFAFFSIENHYHVLYAAESINDIAEYNSNNDLAVFNCTEHAEYAAHAINSHDRLVEEIAQLKSDKAELVEALLATTNKLNESASELHCMIDMKNAELERGICCDDLDPPDYLDAQTVHEGMVQCKISRDLLQKHKG